MYDDAIRPGRIETRTFEIEVDRANAEQRTFPASLSSEQPVSRIWGTEILEHTREAIDFSRVIGGKLPLLAGHDDSEVPRPGNVAEVRLDVAGKRLRGKLQFSDTARGRELLDAVRSGYADSVSIRYLVQEVRRDGTAEDGSPRFRVSRWQPMEASLVNVPADSTVGVGRAASRGDEMETSDPPAPVSGGGNLEAERQRVREIRNLAKLHKVDALGDQAIDGAWPLDRFRRAAMEALGSRNGEPVSSDALTPLGMREEEWARYSLSRALLAQASGDWSAAGFEREVSRATAEASGKRSDKLVVPLAAFKIPNTGQRTVTVGGTGGSLKATVFGEYIDVLRAASVIMNLGPTFLEGLQGDVALPKRSTDEAVQWVAENSTYTPSDATYAQVLLQPKTVSVGTTLSRRLLLQSTPGAEAITRSALAEIVARAIDQVCIQGGGANQPTGILGTAGIGSVVQGNLALSYPTVVNLEREVAVDNALMGALSYLANPQTVAQAKRVFIDAGSGRTIFDTTTPERPLNGYPCAVTSLVPSNLGAGTNRSALIFGNWVDLVVGLWSGVEVEVNPYSDAVWRSGGLEVRCLADVGVALRNAQSFAAAVDIDHSA